ncbi:4a-hydroxytetrahydrobiopterin dehydratase [Marinithermus hydrothermalis]|uniref:4a-hydroxytetrahydrobiopterin dehydratase n=1 Tax=Marinithermus hydrothermalis (strain DSM 14884 / JCM 11576 / T1) TaxID=869210 RepID=F2NM55_MARHT|nr:4a-hydroxytetrahydrobiopterin dehydratase [Marinithermus hydrothermalis]AEB11525.1 transcriptional coactivator/pterin dehydratase [Marinithermus hydrothermalis DSM 14884]
MRRLTREEIAAGLEGLEGWALVADRVEKTFGFASYADGVAFALRVALLAERMDHHPDALTIGWKRVVVAYVTHSVGGVTERDLEAARQVETVYARMFAPNG